MNKKLMLIVNPVAGRGAYANNFAKSLHELHKGGYTTTVFYTNKKGDGEELVQREDGNFDCIACIGGDGTLSEVMSGLIKCKNKVPLGYIPMGTTNDVATTLDLPKNDSFEAVKRFISGKPHPFDVGILNEKEMFAYIAAFGAFTQVSYATPQSQKKALGHLAYVLQGMAALPYIESVNARVEYDDGVVEGRLLYGSMSNSSSVAGIVKLPGDMVCLGDGRSELVLVKEPDGITKFGEILDSVISGRFDSPNLLVLHTTKAKFSFDKPVAWTRDGENGGEHTEVELRNLHAPVELVF